MFHKQEQTNTDFSRKSKCIPQCLCTSKLYEVNPLLLCLKQFFRRAKRASRRGTEHLSATYPIRCASRIIIINEHYNTSSIYRCIQPPY